MKKVVSVFLVITLFLINFQGWEYLKKIDFFQGLSESFAETGTLLEGTGIYYTISNNEVTITGANTSISGNLVIPKSIEGYPVTNIGDLAFQNCENLRNIKIPEKVKHIGSQAFWRCTNLESIKIPESVTSIGETIVRDCDNLICIYGITGSYAETYANENNIPFTSLTTEDSNDFEYSTSDLGITITKYIGDSTEVVIPKEIEGKKVIAIGDCAFLECSSVVSVEISENVKSIGIQAFYNCTSLTNISFPIGLKSIGEEAFVFCSSLESIEIPEGVDKIGNKAFMFCTSLKNININDKNKNYSSIDGVLFDKQAKKIIIYPEGKLDKNYVIPSGVTTIGYAAFCNSSLSYMNIPEGVTTIEKEAFSFCNSLSNISLPKGLTCIESNLFEGCNNLTDINIPEGVTIIGNLAFSDCMSLNAISIPKGVTTIGNAAFGNCRELTNINIPEGVTTIGYSAFAGCENLEYVTIPKSVKSIGENIFDACGKLICIYGEEGSYAQTYAQENNIPFEVIDNISDVNNFEVLRRSATSLVLSWDKVSNAQGYEIYRSTNENGKYEKIKIITNNNILTSTSTGLESATSYYYKIRAYKENDGQKNYGEFTLLKATTNPNKVTGLKTLNSTESSLRIGWDKHDKATGYEVFRSTSENGKYVRVKTITDNNITQNASPYLQSGKTYYYRVKAYLIVDGEKLYSNSATLQAKTKSFGAITGLKMEASTENSIRIGWNYVNDVEGYEIFRSTSEDGKYVKVKTITDNTVTSAASPNLESATTYYYKIRSYKTIDGNKQYGDFSIVQASTKPSVVRNLKLIDITTKGIEINWDNVKGADGYEIFRSNGNDYIKVATISDLKYISSNITKGEVYSYKVKAYKLVRTLKVYGVYSDVLTVKVE